MAPAAARRAKLVQRSNFQGLQGNPDACRPRRGSACNKIARKTGGNARPVSALSVQPTAAMNPRTGGSRVGEAPRPFFPPFLREEMGAPAAQARPARGGHPGKKRRVRDAAPSSQPEKGGRTHRCAPADRFRTVPGSHQTGDYRSPPRAARRVVAPHGASSCGRKRADDIRPYGPVVIAAVSPRPTEKGR